LANEELMSSNEELQSTNEELQSTVEELETSKEELQSINEELVTVNGELQANSDHLTKTQNDLKNLLDNISGGIIFLDQQLCIRRFTSEAVRTLSSAGRRRRPAAGRYQVHYRNA
jgi:two-component system CheB/CheR fusion protein